MTTTQTSTTQTFPTQREWDTAERLGIDLDTYRLYRSFFLAGYEVTPS